MSCYEVRFRVDSGCCSSRTLGARGWALRRCHRGTAGFAVELRNREIVSHDTAHTIGLFAHVIGIALSAVILGGAVMLLRNGNVRLCKLLGVGVSIPAFAPFFGLAFPLGIAAMVVGVRAGRR